MFFLLVPIALLGWAVGSVLSVLVERVLAGRSPREPVLSCARCPGVPASRPTLVATGWLRPRERCAGCGIRPGTRYPLLELSSCLAFVAVAFALLKADRTALLPAWLYFTAMAVALATIDLASSRLPNAIVLPSYPVLAVLLIGAAAWQRDYPAIIRSLVGGLILFGAYFAIAFSYPRGMGLGDVKLAGLIGAMLANLSYSALLVGGFGAFLLGGIAGTAVILSAKGNRKTALPFGPFMLSAAILALFFAQPIVSSYRQLTGV
jgi:leader peptidase (prepilin peptidase)/N-methyltransferase